MSTQGSEGSIRETLVEVGQVLVRDLQEMFGHEEVTSQVEGTGEEVELQVEGPQGSLTVTWPPGEGLTHAQGRLGAHGRVAFEFLLASQAPGEFFRDYRPVSEERRRMVFDQLRFYLEDSLGETGFYEDMVIEERGPAMLIYSDDEYVIVADSGLRRGHGLLDWKVKRLLAYALTDTDEALDT